NQEIMNPEVDLFVPCFIDQLFPETGMNMARILGRCGLKVRYNDQQTCCGQMAFNAGHWDEAKAMGEKFIRDFSHTRYVIGPSASCVGFVRNYYRLLFHNSAYHVEYKQLVSRIYEFTDFMVNVAHCEDVGARFDELVTYHDSCAALREYGIREEPRILLSHVKGLELREMKNTDECCGFGGMFSVKFEPIAVAMAEQKVHHALDTGASYIVSTDASCLMHQWGYIQKHQLPIRVIHIADVLASGW
ncbi:MAG: (Fe-S)-binding protein, partial [Bacteroidales bacterium]|nr:(Fe-S)-binding protein [Bacteroidales bacterium]